MNAYAPLQLRDIEVVIHNLPIVESNILVGVGCDQFLSQPPKAICFYHNGFSLKTIQVGAHGLLKHLLNRLLHLVSPLLNSLCQSGFVQGNRHLCFSP